MKATDKYSIGNRPNWAEKLSNEDLIKLCSDDEKYTEIKKGSGKGLCYLNREIINTSNQKTERYFFKAWNLNNTETLQSASISEIFLYGDQHIVIHRVCLIRDGQIFEKTDTLNIRVLDDERSSAYGTISKIKKVHWTVANLHLQDTFILEYSIVSIFDSDAVLYKKYFRHVQLMPPSYWFYKRYSFKLINNRDENLRTIQKYFRDDKEQIIKEDSTIIKKGNSLIFEKTDFQSPNKNDIFIPYIEIATDATWPQISSQVYSLYQKALGTSNIAKSPTYKNIGLGKDIEENIKKIIEFVQNQIVYLYDAEVMHGHIPQSSDISISQKSGDCKAKSLLLVNLLKTIDIESEIILVNYSQDFFISESLPSPFVFNHVIVKIVHKGKKYFVDSTWTDRSGLLGKRAEPFFSNYLSIASNADLEKRSEEVPSDFNVEENTKIILDDHENSISIETLYRQASADIIRTNFNKADKGQLIENQNRIIAGRMSLDESKDINTFFKDVEYRILSDNKYENVLKVAYKAKLINPYKSLKDGKVFRYYYFLETKNILSYNHKDVPAHSFIAYPLKYDLHIQSKDFIRKRDPITTRDTQIDNDYFNFSNKKSVSFRTATVNSVYQPKIYGDIKAADLKKLKEDYTKINDSNFGIGIMFANFWQYVFRNGYLFIVLSIIMLVIVTATTNSDNFPIDPPAPVVPQNVPRNFVKPVELDWAYSIDTKTYSDPQDKVSFQYPAKSKWTMTTFGDSKSQNRSVVFRLYSKSLSGPSKYAIIGFDAMDLGPKNSLEENVKFHLSEFPNPLAVTRNVQIYPDIVPSDVRVETMEIESYNPMGYGVTTHQKILMMIATRGSLMYEFNLRADVEDYDKFYPLVISMIKSLSFK